MSLGIFSLLLLFTIQYSTSCITKQECLEDISESLDLYDERYVSLEHNYAEILLKHSNNLRKEIVALNAAKLRGPSQCQDFLEDTLDHYVMMVNASCVYSPRDGIPNQVWAQFTSLDPEFFKRVEAKQIDQICNLFVSVLNHYCKQLEGDIMVLKECDFVNSFKNLFVRPWRSCVATQRKLEKKD